MQPGFKAYLGLIAHCKGLTSSNDQGYVKSVLW